MTVDGYAHCGLDKYLPVDALEAAMRASQISAAVLCQHLGQFDNDYIAGLVASSPQRFAAIALVDHGSPTWAEDLTALARRQFRGVRMTSSGLRDNPDFASAVPSAGLIPVIYAAEGIAPLVGPLRELAARHPSTPLVVSHLGMPRVEGDEIKAGEEVLALAAEPNVYVMLSGLHMFCPFPYAPLDGLIAAVLATFGAARVMWGSNFPVCGSNAVDYRRDLDLLVAGRWGLDRAALEAITDTTARKTWFG